jgi:hypothetical protein
LAGFDMHFLGYCGVLCGHHPAAAGQAKTEGLTLNTQPCDGLLSLLKSFLDCLDSRGSDKVFFLFLGFSWVGPFRSVWIWRDLRRPQCPEKFKNYRIKIINSQNQ